uniref:Uncharacterized protein n=1 Tax=Arundo donax TaxID=35708 RepID=A0A0A8YKD5_ARUDO
MTSCSKHSYTTNYLLALSWNIGISWEIV